MVTAKYTEETPIQEVDFTSAAGRGQAAWANVFSQTEDMAYTKAQQLANAKAAQDGIDAVAKFGLGAPYPDSTSEASQHYKQAVDRSQATLLQTQITSKASDLYLTAAEKGFTSDAAQTFKAEWQAYSRATLDRLPPHQRAQGFQNLTSIGAHYGFQLSKNVSSQLIQDQRLDADITQQKLASQLVENVSAGMSLSQPQVVIKDQETLRDSIMNGPGTALQRESKFNQSQKAIFGADITGRLQTLYDARLKAQAEADPKKREKQLELLADQEKQVMTNPTAWIKKVAKTSEFYDGVDGKVGLSAIKAFRSTMTSVLASQAQEANDSHEKLLTQYKNGNIPTQAQINDYVRLSPYDKKAPQKLKQLGQAHDATLAVYSQISDVGGLENMRNQAEKQQFQTSAFGNKIALDILDKLEQKKKSDPRLYAEFLYQRSNMARQTANLAYNKLGATPELVSRVEGARSSPNYLTLIASGKSPFTLPETRIANQYSNSLKSIQIQTGVPLASVQGFTTAAYKDLNTTIQNLPQGQKLAAFKHLYQDPTVRPDYMKVLTHLKSKEDIAQALLAQGEASDSLQRVSDVISNPDLLKASKDSVPKDTRTSIELAAMPHITALFNTYPPKIASALSDIYTARSYMVSQGAVPGYTTGLGLRNTSITGESGSDQLMQETLSSLNLAKIPGQNIIASKELPHNNSHITTDPFLINRNLNNLTQNLVDTNQFYTPISKRGQPGKVEEAKSQAALSTFHHFIPSLTPTSFYLADTYKDDVNAGRWESISPTQVQYFDRYGGAVWLKDDKGNPASEVKMDLGTVQTMVKMRKPDAK